VNTTLSRTTMKGSTMSKGGVVGDFGPGEIELPPGMHDRFDPEDPQYVVSVGDEDLKDHVTPEGSAPDES